jgi:MobA/MobL family
MAIVHVAFKSSSKAPPAAAHAQYIARDGQYQRRGGVELVESGNMPEFAQADPHSFWVAADAQERANGRAYTEIQIALPRELDRGQREELARETTRELLGDRFAYTMAVHVPLAKDNIDQPHMHLMFSERAVDATTRGLAEDRFFKRNGAKKDPAWNDRNKPEEVREKWVEMMNGAMQRAGIEQRMDARSWADQGREDLAALREPKLLGGNGTEAAELRQQVDELRRQREELPAPHLDQAAAVQELEKRAEAEVARIEQRRDEQVSILDKLIEKARELAVEVKERTVAAARNVADRIESFFGAGERGALAEKASAKEQEQARPPTPESAHERIDEKLSALDRRLAAQQSIDDKLANLDKRLEEQAKAQQEKELSQKQEIEISPRSRGRDFGIER